MNIIFPICGIGNRFQESGYTVPKPLINILGEPMFFWVLDNLTIHPTDQIYIVYNTILNNYNFADRIHFKYPDLNIIYIELTEPTNGATETISKVLPYITNNEEILILDNDTFYEDDIISKFRDVKDNCIFYFEDTQDKPLFSYISIFDNKVFDIKEKEKISNNANTGAYGFKDIQTLTKYINIVLNKSYDKEKYTSFVYKEMLINNESITAVKIDNVIFLGTPDQLKFFTVTTNKFKNKRICFDLDNTLVSYPQVVGDYSTVLPINRNIQLLKYLKSLGNTIIIYTARRMRTFNGDVAKVTADIGKVTFETLDKFDIPYDELYFGKPYAHFYIDDLGINCFNDLEKELGFYINKNETRSFNLVEYNGNRVSKTTNNDGEAFYYNNIPEHLKYLFPNVYNIIDNTIEMENIKGFSLSNLYVNETLTIELFQKVLDSLEVIHQYRTDDNIDIYANYKPKMIERFEKNQLFYKEIDTNALYNRIIESLDLHVNMGLKNMIHGDPVFTNIIIDSNQNIKFIDMRGKVGDVKTIFGDVFYDYAKILQSIMGYDYILNGKTPNTTYINKFKEYFNNYIITKYNEQSLRYVETITQSLLFSMLPLHDDTNKIKQYYNLIQTI